MGWEWVGISCPLYPAVGHELPTADTADCADTQSLPVVWD